MSVNENDPRPDDPMDEASSGDATDQAAVAAPESGKKQPSRVMRMGLKRLENVGRFWSTRSRIPSILLGSILLFLVIAVVWASTAQLDHVVRGTGEVVTSAQTQRISSLEGGLLRRVHVREGDLVEEGTLLAELDPTQSQSSFGQMRQQQLALQARLARLRAEHEDKRLEFPAEMTAQAPEVVAAERSAYSERREVHAIERSVLEEQVIQQQNTLADAQTEADVARRQLTLVEREYTVTRDLVERQLEAELSLLAAQRQLNDAQARVRKAELAIDSAQAALNEARERLSQHDATFRRDVGLEIADTAGRLAEVREQIRGLQDRLSRTNLRAPMAAVVNTINVRTVGGVIQPGEPMLELTPVNVPVQIQAEIAPKDIAFMELGQIVNIKLTAYDFARFGGLDGEIVFVGSDALERQDGTRYFEIRVETENPWIESEGQRYPITPGMAANVDVLVSKRTVLDYLIEPVFRLKDRAFTE